MIKNRCDHPQSTRCELLNPVDWGEFHSIPLGVTNFEQIVCDFQHWGPNSNETFIFVIKRLRDNSLDGSKLL